MDLKHLIELVENDFLYIVVDNLKREIITAQEAKSACKNFLKMLPFESEKDIENKITSFCNKNPLYSLLTRKLAAYEEEEKTKQVLEKMRAHIKENRIDEALQLVQK